MKKVVPPPQHIRKLFIDYLNSKEEAHDLFLKLYYPNIFNVRRNQNNKISKRKVRKTR